MNIYLLELAGKWISLFCVSILSFFGNISIVENKLMSENMEKDKSLSIVNTIIPHQTIIKPKSNLPSDTKNIIVEGQDGIVLKENGEIIQTYRDVVDEVIEVGTGPIGAYNGRMTGYGPDCKTCSGIGKVACPTQDRKYHSLIQDGIYYADIDYGQTRIVAATKTIFPCGTIIEVNKNHEKFMAIVLDRGGAIENAWNNNQQILIDLSFESEKNPEIFKVTSNDVNYKVKRWGW